MSLDNRQFDFTLTKDEGIDNYTLEESSEITERRTIVTLFSVRQKYTKSMPRNAKTIALRIVEHCLEYFLLSRMPIVTLSDPAQDNTINLDHLYEEVVGKSEKTRLDIGKHTFYLTHFLLHTTSRVGHHISYCAHDRTVKTDILRFANLPSTLSSPNNDDSFVYAGYVSAEFLDEHVNFVRTDFETIPEGGFSFHDELTWEEITVPVLAASEKYLEPFISVVRAQKAERIREYVNGNAPEYRHILKNHPDKLDKIPPDVSDKKLDSELYELHREIEIDLRHEAETLLEETSSRDGNYQQAWEKFAEFWQDYNDVGKANLAQYIIHRKIMLSILEKSLMRSGDGKYSQEEVIHKIIFPMKKTSDEITYDEHNLWIIDEKLSYHEYLASDIPLNKIEKLENSSKSRPDLLIFDGPIAIVDDSSPYGSGIVIFEFKRPMRDDYSDDENPIRQVLEYVQKIKEGKIQNKDGRLISIPDHTPFYCYVVCDLTQKIKHESTMYDFTLTPDAGGYFGYHRQVGAYVEILSFDKLIGDAKKRNRILFEKLMLPEKM